MHFKVRVDLVTTVVAVTVVIEATAREDLAWTSQHCRHFPCPPHWWNAHGTSRSFTQLPPVYRWHRGPEMLSNVLRSPSRKWLSDSHRHRAASRGPGQLTGTRQLWELRLEEGSEAARPED